MRPEPLPETPAPPSAPARDSRPTLSPDLRRPCSRYLGVHGGLVCAGTAAVEVSQLVFLVDGVEALAAGAARHVLADAVLPLLFLGRGEAGGWAWVKGHMDTLRDFPSLPLCLASPASDPSLGVRMPRSTTHLPLMTCT